MDWENILSDSVKDGRIRELHLKRIPVLKTCDNWKKVVPIGWIDHQMRISHYKGGLVKLNGKLLFVSEKTIDALSLYIDWRFPRRIKVIQD